MEHEEQEREHFQKIIYIFKSYRRHANNWVDGKMKFLKNLPVDQQSLLINYNDHLAKVRKCIEQNAQILNLIIKDVENMFENLNHSDSEIQRFTDASVQTDMDKLHTTLRQIVRDWSTVGEPERKLCYNPILEAIEARFPKDTCDRGEVNVLVPGAGLGRLSYEVAKRGFSCQGNEFSLFMLFASNFVLNRCEDKLRIHPWAHSSCNVMRSEDQVLAVQFPDVDPSDLPASSQMTMTAGDFMEVYTAASVWDCVATCFFIDCANNVVSLIQTIYNIIKPGGIWVNLGPLLYHFADGQESLELTYEQLIDIVKNVGFTILEEKTDLPTSYIHNRNSMLQSQYRSVFFVAEKPNIR